MIDHERIRFKEHTAEQLHQRLAHLDIDLRLARRIQAAVMQKVGEVPTSMPEVPRKKLHSVREATVIPRLELVEKAVSPTDGFAKYLFRGEGEGVFEAIRIPLLHRPGDEKYVICVSSQVGCAMGCTFCATGRMGFKRNLATWEIVDQVMHIRDESPYPVRGVVFMGMGEPMLNYERVMRAAEVMSDPCGLAIEGKAITISTVGIVPAIRRFTAENRLYRLIISLTAATSEKRRQMFPVEDIHPLEELITAVREYQEATGNRINLAWTMLDGINTSEADARALAELTAGMPIRIDLIDVNDATGQFRTPSPEGLQIFRNALTQYVGMPIARRYSGGADIHGACGMLAGQVIQPSESELPTTETAS